MPEEKSRLGKKMIYVIGSSVAGMITNHFSFEIAPVFEGDFVELVNILYSFPGDVEIYKVLQGDEWTSLTEEKLRCPSMEQTKFLKIIGQIFSKQGKAYVVTPRYVKEEFHALKMLLESVANPPTSDESWEDYIKSGEGYNSTTVYPFPFDTIKLYAATLLLVTFEGKPIVNNLIYYFKNGDSVTFLIREVEARRYICVGATLVLSSGKALRQVLAHPGIFISSADFPQKKGKIVSSIAGEECSQFHDMMSFRVFPTTHAISLRRLGMHGTVNSNHVLDDSDDLLAFGVRGGAMVVINFELPIVKLSRIDAIYSFVSTAFLDEILALMIMPCKPKTVVTCNACHFSLSHCLKWLYETFVQATKISLMQLLELAIGLPIDAKIIWSGFIRKLEEQKGPNFLTALINKFMEKGVQMVVLGFAKKNFEQNIEQLEVSYRKEATRVGMWNCKTSVMDALIESILYLASSSRHGVDL